MAFFMQHISEITRNHLFIEGKQRIAKCLACIPEALIHQSPNAQITPVANQVVHLNGNIRQWLGEGLLGCAYTRARHQEFQASDLTSEQLMLLWEELEQDLVPHVSKLDRLNLHTAVCIQGFHTTVLGAWLHVLEHFSYHVGQMSLLAKYYSNQDLGYYEGLDLEVQ